MDSSADARADPDAPARLGAGVTPAGGATGRRPGSERLPDPLRRMVALGGSVRDLASRPSVRPWLFAMTGLVFVVLSVVSFRALPEGGRSARPALVVVIVFVTAPATLTLNALEYRFMATRLGYRVDVRHALRISLIASIANYLPAPGGVAVRTAALKRQGSTVRSAISINAVAGLMWLGATGLVGGGAIIANHRLAGRAAIVAVLGLAMIAASVLWLRRGGGDWPRMFRQLMAIEVAMVLVSGARLWLAFAAIGQPAGLGASIAISSSAVFAALLGVFPAGLGLREILAGGIARAVHVSAAAAVAATAVDRIGCQIGMAIAAVVLGIRRKDLAGDQRPETSPAQP